MAAVSSYVRCCTRLGLVLAALWTLRSASFAQSLPEIAPPTNTVQDAQPQLPPSTMPRFPGGHVMPEGQFAQPASPSVNPPGPLPGGASQPNTSEAEQLPDPLGTDVLPTPPPLGTPQTQKVDPTGKMVADVRVVGNESIPTKRIASQIKSRPGRTFESALVRDDIRALNRTRWFLHVEAEYLPAPDDGVVVVFRVVERQRIQYVKFLGNTKSRRKTLEKKAELKEGDPLDPYSIERAREAILTFYREAGFNRVRVEILEGTKRGDKGAVFLIDEGEKQRIADVEFVGNQIASDGRLKTQIQSKPPFLGIFGGYVDRDKIDADIERLTAYYRSLGFFQARVGVEPEFNEELDRLKLTFVIHEGIRYKVRNVTVAGVTKFNTEELLAELKLRQDDFFDQPKMQGDVEKLKEVYGAVGYIFADVQAEPRFLEEPGTLDLVYTINEGHRYRVGRIDVQITGENPHTRIRTVLNRMDLRPGDVVDIRKLRDAERRLRASGLFRNEPHLGVTPKILVQPAEMEIDDTLLGQAEGGNARGQSPDRHVVQKPAVLTIQGELAPGPADVTQPVAQQQPQSPAAAPRGNFGGYQAPVQPGQPYAAPQQPIAAGAAPPRPWQRAAAPGMAQPAAPPAQQHYQAAPHQAYQGQPVAQQNHMMQPGQPAQPVPYGAGYPAPAQPQQVPPPQAQQAVGGTNRQPAAPTDRVPWRENVRYQSPDTAPTGWTAPASTYSGGARYSTATNSGDGYRPATRDPNPNPAPTAPNTRLAQVPPPTAPPATPGFMPPPPGAPVTLPPPPGAGATADPIIPPGGYINLDEPDREAILIPQVEETQTGRLSFGVGVNSEAGVVGNIVLDEQNFDITRFPRGFSELGTGTAFRGAGQRLRIEAVPGSEVQRYMFTFREPYLLDTPISFGVNAFYFDRIYDDWDEQRLGGNISLGYQIRPDLSVGLTLRAENVNISDPAFGAPQELLDVVGDNGLYSLKANIVHDTRDSAFMPTEGHFIELAYEQNFGDFDFGRPTIEGRQYFMLRQRPDGSGRHVLSFRGRAGITGSQTPVFENFFAGGFSTLRGFDFRGASPVKQGVIVGGELMLLGSVEYMFPLTADDMLRGVVFCDFGTVEETVRIDSDNFRVAPGVGLRITIPAMGPAPIALDFAYPVMMADTDDKQIFSFYVGLLR